MTWIEEYGIIVPYNCELIGGDKIRVATKQLIDLTLKVGGDFEVIGLITAKKHGEWKPSSDGVRALKTTKQFKKDVNRLKKQRKNFDKLKIVLDAICEEHDLEIKYRDHKLTGNYVEARECHIEPDWLLIYEVDDDTVILRRTGSHSELFKM